jgi:hypothetical protein
LPLLSEQKKGDFEINLKAKFDIPKDNETKKYGIWTGKTESPVGKYTLSYYKDN